MIKIIFLAIIAFVFTLPMGFRILGAVLAGKGSKSKKDEKPNGFASWVNCILQRINPVTGTPKNFFVWIWDLMVKFKTKIYSSTEKLWKIVWDNKQGETLFRVRACNFVTWFIIILVAFYIIKLQANNWLDHLYLWLSTL